ncbi:hypothetical protein [Bacillus safensis]|uniref:hypothetical protein n=1 Tax=Bacillus safensis TaxID=561879 RepID=UPI0021E54419|nr:hypothetical protein [Bacillus safensis]UXO88778.1 hypothetical protein N7921_03495 [Bacillus safensis]
MDYKEMFEVKEEIRKSLEDVAERAARSVFAKVDKQSLEGAVITGHIAKQEFLDAFDLEYMFLFNQCDEIETDVVSGKK